MLDKIFKNNALLPCLNRLSRKSLASTPSSGLYRARAVPTFTARIEQCRIVNR
jgi:hypothetical protein